MVLGICKYCGKVAQVNICRSCYYEYHESKSELMDGTRDKEEELGNGGEEVKELDEDAGADR